MMMAHLLELFIKLIDAMFDMVMENKFVIFSAMQFLFHKACSYYVAPGRKSVKGFIRFVLGVSVKDGSKDEPKA